MSLIENDLDGANVGICMDVGHAFIMGDLADAIEACSGHLITTHLHDNNGKSDDHLAPGEGSIDWPLALMSLQKIGYDGDVDVRGRQHVDAARGARKDREGAPTVSRSCSTSASRHHARTRTPRAPVRHARNHRATSASTSAKPSPSRAGCTTAVERQDPFPRRPRRHRVPPGRHGQERRAARRPSRPPITSRRRASIIVTGTVREDKRAKGGYELTANGARGRRAGARLSDHAEGARRRLPARSPASVDPRRAADRDPARAARSHQRRPRLLQQPAASSSPTRRSSRRRRARARRRCFRCSTSRTPRRS